MNRRHNSYQYTLRTWSSPLAFAADDKRALHPRRIGDPIGEPYIDRPELPLVEVRGEEGRHFPVIPLGKNRLED